MHIKASTSLFFTHFFFFIEKIMVSQHLKAPESFSFRIKTSSINHCSKSTVPNSPEFTIIHFQATDHVLISFPELERGRGKKKKNLAGPFW